MSISTGYVISLFTNDQTAISEAFSSQLHYEKKWKCGLKYGQGLKMHENKVNLFMRSKGSELLCLRHSTDKFTVCT